MIIIVTTLNEHDDNCDKFNEHDDNCDKFNEHDNCDNIKW